MITNINSYKEWKGTLRTGGLTWLPIFRLSFRLAIKRKFSKGLMIFSGLNPFFYLAAIYIATKPELKTVIRLPIFRVLQSSPAIFESFFMNQIFYLFLLAIFFGSNLVAGEFRAKAFPLYFSRPLSEWDYLTAKIGVVLAFSLLYSFVPSLLFVVARLIFAGSLEMGLLSTLGLVLLPLLIGLFYASFIILFSIMVRSVRLAELLAFFGYYFLSTLGEVLPRILKNSYYMLLSPDHNIRRTISAFFTGKFHPEIPAVLSLAIVLGLSGLFVGLIFWLLRKKEREL